MILKKLDDTIGNLASYIIKNNNNELNKTENRLIKIERAFESIDWDKYEAYLEYNKRVDYKGGSYAYRLKKEDEVAVLDGHMVKQGVFDWHHHDSKEILVVYRGRVKNINNGGGEYGVGDIIVVEPGTNHKMMALEETDLIAITIPKDEGYP